jgi:hypothetical protein
MAQPARPSPIAAGYTLYDTAGGILLDEKSKISPKNNLSVPSGAWIRRKTLIHNKLCA